MLEELKQVLPALGKKKLSAYLVIRNGTVTAFNGEQVLSVPIATDLSFAPKGHAFIRAVKKCKNKTIALWVNEQGNVMLHTEDFDKTVACAPMADFPAEIQTGFWFDVKKPRKPPAPKAVPPEPVWLRADYLPGLEEAKAFRLPLFTWEEVIAAAMAKEPFLCDCETYKNYFCVAFCGSVSGKRYLFEMKQGEALDLVKLRWIMDHVLCVTFNGNEFDFPILALALAGWNCAQLKWAADQLIGQQKKPWQLLKSAKTSKLKTDHIDLIEVCPLGGSLKLYAGRLHSRKIQDLPFPPDAYLSEDQIAILRYYCASSDLTATALCFWNLREQIEIRQKMGEQYGLDLRSKSDAQIAEAVIKGEIQKLTFAEPYRTEVAPGTRYKYKPPAFISFQTPLLSRVFETIKAWDFVVNENGYVEVPVDPSTGKAWNLQVKIAEGLYTIGMGGLHSNEETVCHRADAETMICDRDVASYYPAIILNLELYPQHLGPAFLQVFRAIRDRRLAAKAAAKKAKEAGQHELERAQKAIAECLKIVVNGTFGKTLSKWSTIYAPDLGLTITITGQLSLLMLIERFELAGITVCSANTDGIVFKHARSRKAEAEAIVAQWEKETNFQTEETEYAAVYSRDVNNYIAVKTDGKTKAKGSYFDPWESEEFRYERFKKNPECSIAIEAAKAFLTKQTPVAHTVRTCTDFKKFVLIRTARGGAAKNGVYLGRVPRWYYSTEETGAILTCAKGHEVAQSDGSRPCMELPQGMPPDVDFARYEAVALSILQEIGAISVPSA